MHIRCDKHGQPLVVLLSPGPQHESTVFPALMERGQVKRPGPGPPRLRPRRVAGDKGYSYPHIRRYLRQRGIRVTIPRRKDQPHGGRFARAPYRARNVFERLIGRLKQNRRIATLAESYRMMWVLGAINLFSSSNTP